MDNTDEFYFIALNSNDENERSKAATSLLEIGHPKALDACIRTINDVEDILHLDYTPSVHCLIRIGEPALPSLFPLLLYDDKITRLRAIRSIELITLDVWKKEKKSLENWGEWWEEIAFDYEADIGDREKSVNKLNKWMASRN